jgi:hypothetical protein
MDPNYLDLAYLAMGDKLCKFDADTGDYSTCIKKYPEQFSERGTSISNLLFAIIGESTLVAVDLTEMLDQTGIALIITFSCLAGVCIILPFILLCLRFMRTSYVRHVKNLEIRTLLLDHSTSGSVLELMNSGGNDFFIKIQDLKFTGRLAEGSYGVVFKGVYRGTPVAIKRMKIEDENDDFYNEVRALKSLRHPNIVLFMGVCMQEDHKLIVTELMPGGGLDVALRKEMTLDSKIRILLDVVRGMIYLHMLDPPMLHRDLKPSNILVCNMNDY